MNVFLFAKGKSFPKAGNACSPSHEQLVHKPRSLFFRWRCRSLGILCHRTDQVGNIWEILGMGQLKLKLNLNVEVAVPSKWNVDIVGLEKSLRSVLYHVPCVLHYVWWCMILFDVRWWCMIMMHDDDDDDDDVVWCLMMMNYDWFKIYVKFVGAILSHHQSFYCIHFRLTVKTKERRLLLPWLCLSGRG